MATPRVSDIEVKDGMFIWEDYVLSPCKNAFNDKTSYWLSKRGYIISVYAFTPMSNKELELENIAKIFQSTIMLLAWKLSPKERIS
ncbi:MAG: hypothetical protein K6F27_09615 [Ruminococcus sp.]|nr:hypothetical protein [Ruminococcus sp.]